MKNRKHSKRIVSMLLCLLMILSLLPFGAMAEAEPLNCGDDKEQSWGDHVDIRVAGTLTIKTKVNGTVTSEEKINITTSDVTGVLKSVDKNGKTTTKNLSFWEKSGYGNENEWRCTGLQLKPAKDTVSITCTLNGQQKGGTTIKKTVTMTYTGESTLRSFIANCPGKNGYDININAEDLTEHFTVDKTVTKVWNDDNNRDGMRPSSILVQLYADGQKYGNPVTLNAANNWKATFENLPDNATYTVQEVSVPNGYTSSVDNGTLTITNTHQIETVTVAGTKTWNDQNDQDGLRPEKITVNLLADGEKIDSKEVTAENQWSWNFQNLPKFKDGKEIVYTITEDAVDGYTSDTNGYNLTNTHQVKTVTVSGTKTWNDNNNQDGKRPEKITVNLLADGEQIKSKEVTADDGWTYSFTELPEYKNGKKITYTITEGAVDGYTSDTNGYNLTNTHTPATTTVSGTKTWNDNNNQDGLRPEKITVNLLADGEQIKSKEVTADDGWTYSFTELPEYKNGKKITYTITEDAVKDYTATTDGYNLTNTHTPATTTVSGTKTWNDNNNQDGIRPASITVNLMANGVHKTSKTVTANNNWSYSFTNLPVYENGKEIVYTIEEKAVDGYTTTINDYNLTNTHIPETTSVSGTKTWVDDENRDGLRPEKITVNLLADGKKIDFKEVTAENQWSWNFQNLPKFKDGKEIVYTIEEEAVDGYTATTDGYNLTNTHETEKVKLTVKKIWDDDDNRDGLRPASIFVKIMKGKEEIATAKIYASGNWEWTSEDLPKYENGQEIEYSIIEMKVEDYEASYDGLTVTNTHEIETITVSGSKTWDDDDNRDGIRPEKITVNLLANGDKVATMDVSEKEQWTWTFENLPKYDGGEEIEYTIEELEVVGYETECDGYDLINTHEPVTVKFTVTKKWDDKDNQDGLRPEKVTVYILANGEKTEEVLTLSAENQWTAGIEGLPEFEGGKKIVYTLEEKPVEGYTAKVTGTIEEGFVLTNTHTPEEPTETEPTVPETTVPETTQPKPTTPAKPTDSPKTGDNSNLFLWSALLLASILGMTALVVTKKNRV